MKIQYVAFFQFGCAVFVVLGAGPQGIETYVPNYDATAASGQYQAHTVQAATYPYPQAGNPYAYPVYMPQPYPYYPQHYNYPYPNQQYGYGQYNKQGGLSAGGILGSAGLLLFGFFSMMFMMFFFILMFGMVSGGGFFGGGSSTNDLLLASAIGGGD